MMADLFSVRHGETVWHVENRYAGWSDVELSHQGRDQRPARLPTGRPQRTWMRSGARGLDVPRRSLSPLLKRPAWS